MSTAADGMTDREVLRLVNDYIGEEGAGLLAGFTYASLAEFYPHHCGLRVDVGGLRTAGMTMRKIFIHVLQEASRHEQARIIRGTLKKFPPSHTAPRSELAGEFERLAMRLESGAAVEGEALAIRSAVVTRALDDATMLLRESGATSGIDRLHTVLHGYLMAICREFRIAFEERSTVNQLLKRILTEHPAMRIDHPRAGEVRTILKGLGSILDALNPIRNQASVAHPNEHLLEEDEAVLVVDAARTLMNYLNRKLAIR